MSGQNIQKKECFQITLFLFSASGGSFQGFLSPLSPKWREGDLKFKWLTGWNGKSQGQAGAGRGVQEVEVWRIQGRKRSSGKKEVLEEPVWGEFKFPKEASEVPHYPLQNHANKEVGRVGTTCSQNGLNKGVTVNYEVPVGEVGPSRENTEVSERARKNFPVHGIRE